MEKDSDEFHALSQRGAPVLSHLLRYFRTAGFLCAIWGVGYYHFSPAWVLLLTFFSLFNEEYYSKVKFARFLFARQSDVNERKAILARSNELPSWVFFPDVERAEWLNKMIRQMWPYIGEYVKDVLKTTVQPSVDNSLPSSLKPFKFETINLGSVPPRIGGVKVYIDNMKRDEILLDLEIIYSSDAEIKVAVRGFNAGIKGLSIHGQLRVLMNPLVKQMPIIGGLQVFFLNPPTIDFDLTNTANVLDMPLLRNTLRTIIADQIAYYLVLPNKIPVTLVECEGMDQMKYPQPQGVLRLHVAAARELKRADFKLVGKGKSDPYVKIYVGAQAFTTKVIADTVSPVWNEYFEAAVDQKFGQFVEMEVLDEDPGEDDELGEASLDIQNIADKGSIDTWLPLENVATGMIHVRALWLHLSRNPDDLDKIFSDNAKAHSEMMSSEDHLSSALLCVNLDQAKALPRKKMQEPSPYCKLSIGNNKQQSVPQAKTADPMWNQNFEFLVLDPRNQDLLVEVFDSNKDKKRLAYVEIPLKNLMSAPNMTVHRPWQLKEGTALSKITLRLCLRILTSTKPEGQDEPLADTIVSSVDPDDINIPDTPPQSPVPDSLGISEPVSLSGHIDPGVGGSEPSSPVTIGGDSTANFTMGDSDSMASNGEMVVRQRTAAPLSSAAEVGDGLGRVQITLRYSAQRNKLIAVIHKCEKLIPCDDDQLADPYVKMYLLPDKSSKKKTNIVKNNLNPVFDETFDWTVSQSELPLRSLEITVKNEVSLFSNNRKQMGCVRIDLNQVDVTKASTEWYELEDWGDDGKRD